MLCKVHAGVSVGSRRGVVRDVVVALDLGLNLGGALLCEVLKGARRRIRREV